MNTSERCKQAAASARSFFAVFIRREQPRLCATDAADRCGYCNGFGDGAERRAFIAAWSDEEAKVSG